MSLRSSVRRSAMHLLAIAVLLSSGGGCISRRDTLLRLRQEQEEVRRAKELGLARSHEPRVALSTLEGMRREELHAQLGTPTRCASVNGVFAVRPRASACDRYAFEALPPETQEGGGRALYVYYGSDGRVEDAEWLVEP